MYYLDSAVYTESGYEKGENPQLRKFISYKNCLFEFVPRANSITSVNKAGMVREQEAEYFINVMPARKDTVYQVDAFTKKCTLQGKTTFWNKETGLIYKEPNTHYPELMNAINYRNKRDSIINHHKFLVTDSNFILNDTMPVKSYYFFLEQPPVHTIYNINFTGKRNTPYQFAGIKTMHGEKTITQYTISSIGYLTSEDAAICDKIIARLNI